MSDNNRHRAHSVSLRKIVGQKWGLVYEIWHLKAGLALPIVSAFSANALLAATIPPSIVYDASVKHTVEKRAMQNLPAFPPISLEKFDAAIPPFTSEELWARIRALLMAYEGEITPADVERVFGVRLKKGFYGGSHRYYYSKDAPQDAWYESISILYGPEFNDIIFTTNWKSTSFAEKYLSKEYVMVSLKDSKWQLQSEFRHHGIQRDIYCYKNYNLYVDMNGNIVHGITFGQVLHGGKNCIPEDQKIGGRIAQ